jgi:hypothetical protein
MPGVDAAGGAGAATTSGGADKSSPASFAVREIDALSGAAETGMRTSVPELSTIDHRPRGNTPRMR